MKDIFYNENASENCKKDLPSMHVRPNNLDDENAPYLTPTPGMIPIVTSSPIPYGMTPDSDMIMKIHECGINVIKIEPNQSEVLFELFKNSEFKNDFVKIIISQQAFFKVDYLKLVNEYRDNIYLGGWCLRDEPQYYNWHKIPVNNNIVENLPEIPKDTQFTENLIQLYNEVRNLDPNHIVFLNLACSMNPMYVGNYVTYEAYLDAFQNAFKPGLWCFDYYPIIGADKEGNWWVNYSSFYKYLKNYSDISKSTHRPFWSYVMCMSSSNKERFTYPIPTEPMVRYQAFTALAFGAKGILYYYYAKGNYTNSNSKYETSPINGEGKETKVWEYLQHVNREIADLNRAFLYTKHMAIFRTSNGLSGENIEKIDLPYGPILSLETEFNDLESIPDLSNESKPDGAFVSHYNYGPINYMLIINRNLKHSQTLKIEFDDETELKVVKACGVIGDVINPIDEIIWGGSYDWEMLPSGYIVFSWDEREITNPYISPTPGEFPIIVATSVPEGKEPTSEDIEGIIECNANVFIDKPENADILLKYMKGKNIKAVFSQGDLKNGEFLMCVRKYMTNENIGAWLLRDNPYYFNWHDHKENEKVEGCTLPNTGNDEKYKEDLRPLYKEIMDWDPLHSVYFKLAATLSPCYVGNIRSYEQYLLVFQNEFKPALWSFDYYPITGSNDNWKCDYHNFFTWLNIFSKNSIATERPFWFYCQSVGCEYNNKPKYPTPTERMLRFEAFTALAFGAKGIAYGYYAKREDSDGWKYTAMPIDSNGEKTSVWYALKQINSEIEQFSQVFLNTKLVGIFSSGGAFDPIDRITLPYGPLVTLSALDMGVHLSHLQENHDNYLVLVSRSVYYTLKVTTKFEFMKLVKFVGGATYTKKVIKPANTEYSEEVEWTLEPGGYIIFHFDDREPL